MMGKQGFLHCFTDVFELEGGFTFKAGNTSRFICELSGMSGWALSHVDWERPGKSESDVVGRFLLSAMGGTRSFCFYGPLTYDIGLQLGCLHPTVASDMQH